MKKEDKDICKAELQWRKTDVKRFKKCVMENEENYEEEVNEVIEIHDSEDETWLQVFTRL